MTIPDRHAKDDPERDTYDPEPYRQAALDSVIETIMLFGQWPQPRSSLRIWLNEQPRRVEFDLAEWMAENFEPAEMSAFIVAHICNDDDRNARQDDIERRIETQLRDELAESGMVESKIEELHEEEREEHDGR